MDYFELVDKLKDEGYLKTPLIYEAFKKINRADFLPDGLKDQAGMDAPLPIGFGQTNSQPLTVAFMLEILQPWPGEKILDVGSGSGWTSALLAWCVSGGEGYGQRFAPPLAEQSAAPRPEIGKVFAIERIPELCQFGKKNISKYNFITRGIVKTICADGARGLPENAPFDKIIAAASAEKIPQAWKKQLKIGGRLVLPVSESIRLLLKKSADKFEEREFPGFIFVPLVTESNKQ